jgi:hypothetical protein
VIVIFAQTSAMEIGKVLSRDRCPPHATLQQALARQGGLIHHLASFISGAQQIRADTSAAAPPSRSVT